MARDPSVLNYWRPDESFDSSDVAIVPILWPAYAWRVVAPRPRDDGLNLFQRAVLGACRAGGFHREALGGKLGLHEKLISVILGELAQLDLIDDSGRPTDAGLIALTDEDLLWAGAVTGWFFQDPWSRSLFPHFATEGFPFADAEFSGKHGARIKMANRWFDAYLLEGPECLATPDADALARALRAHQRREKHQRHMDEEWSSRAQQATARLDTEKALEVIDERPEPVLLLTVGRMAREDVGATLDDPFGLGEVPQLWIDLQRIAQQNGADSRLAKCVQAVADLARMERDSMTEGLRGDLRREAQKRVAGVLSPEISRAESVFEHLVRMELDLIDASAEPDDPWHRWDNARNDARKALEAVLKEVEASDPPVAGMSEMLPDDEESSRVVLNQRAQDLGFKSPLPHELRIDRRDRTFLRRWEPGRSYNIQLGIIALLLRGAQLQGPRLREIAAIAPDFFDIVIRLKREGNRGSHDNESNAQLSLEDTARDVASMRVDCYRTVSLLLDLPFKPDSRIYTT